MGDESELQTNSNQDDACAILVHGNDINKDKFKFISVIKKRLRKEETIA